MDTTVRLRIAYSVKRFPNYDDSLNQTNMILVIFAAYLYGITGARLYSNQEVFMNKVKTNKSASVYNATDDHSLDETAGTLTPGILFFYLNLTIGVMIIYYLISYCFFRCCPRFDYCPKFCLSRNWKLNNKVIVKRLPSFYDVLSEE